MPEGMRKFYADVNNNSRSARFSDWMINGKGLPVKQTIRNSIKDLAVKRYTKL
jgi:hypothetical protein